MREVSKNQFHQSTEVSVTLLFVKTFDLQAAVRAVVSIRGASIEVFPNGTISERNTAASAFSNEARTSGDPFLNPQEWENEALRVMRGSYFEGQGSVARVTVRALPGKNSPHLGNFWQRFHREIGTF